jgi:hypothetical protein
MIMATFVERHDFAGKTVFPVVTYAVSGLATPPTTTSACAPARASVRGLRFAVSGYGRPGRRSTGGEAGRVHKIEPFAP